MVQYRIEWRYNHTNYTSNGDWFEEKDVLNIIIKNIKVISITGLLQNN